MIVIGGSSFIGNKICEHFSRIGKEFVGTYYKNPKNKMVYFDLKNPDLKKLNVDLGEVKFIVICSAISLPDECKRNEEESYQINVEGTIKLLKQCFELGIIPIWFSSEYVFDGYTYDVDDNNYDEMSERNPNTVYGKQKKEVEDFLLNSGKNFLILRISKVHGIDKDNRNYLGSFAEQFYEGKTLKCATDQVFSPLYVGDLVNVLEICMDNNLKGMYNLASPENYSKYDIGLLIKEEFGDKANGEVVKCSLNDFEFYDNRPLNTTMNVDKIIRDTGYEFKTLRECVREMVNG